MVSKGDTFMLLCVRWYLKYSTSYRQRAGMLGWPGAEVESERRRFARKYVA